MVMSKRNRVFRWGLLAGFLLFFIPVCRSDSTAPKNIILFIADGCGFNHIDAASLFQYGRTGNQVYEKFPVKLAMSTFPEAGMGYDSVAAWEAFDYVRMFPTDSAASATAMATGFKTENSVINMDAAGNRLKTFFKKAKELGKATGVVTSVPMSHATPACFLGHNQDRENYKEISREMLLESRADVIMGCGHPDFNKRGNLSSLKRYKYVGGEVLWGLLLAGTAGSDMDADGIDDPWTLIQDRADFQALKQGPTPKRVFGVAPILDTLQQERGGDRFAPPFMVPMIESVPTLGEMTAAALNVLDNNENGFLMMIEGGAVDWAGHDQHKGRMIEELIDFNLTVEKVIAWVETHSSWEETLVIVTSDHETGYLWGPGSGQTLPPYARNWNEVWTSLVNKSKGKVPGMEWHSEHHTNSLVPFYAKGAGSRLFLHFADQNDPVRGKYLDNTEIAAAIFSLLKK